MKILIWSEEWFASTYSKLLVLGSGNLKTEKGKPFWGCELELEEVQNRTKTDSHHSLAIVCPPVWNQSLQTRISSLSIYWSKFLTGNIWLGFANCTFRWRHLQICECKCVGTIHYLKFAYLPKLPSLAPAESRCHQVHSNLNEDLPWWGLVPVGVLPA